jgi:16S rRNA (guanine966-N2)-methyltransferase
MRIIAGEFRSRKLQSVPGLAVRPTPDRLRESLFSILTPRVQGCVFADAYAGSGAVGLEALSRGARQVLLIERDRRALEVIAANVEGLQVADRVKVLRGGASFLLASHEADIVFLDPPYEQVHEYHDSLLSVAKTSCQLAIAQHPSKLSLEASYGTLVRGRVVRQGDNSLSFFDRSDTE